MKEQPVKIAVVRFSSMGDIAIAIPVLEQLLEHYPNVQLFIVSKPFFKKLFAPLPRTNVLDIDLKGRHAGVVGLWRLAKMLKAENIDYLADLHDVLRSKILRFYLALLKVSHAHIHKGRKEKAALVRRRNKKLKPLQHSSLRYVEVFAELGFPFPFTFKEKISRKKLQLSQQLQRAYPSKNNQKRLGVAPFAAHIAKQYPKQLTLEVIHCMLKEEKELEVFLFGGGAKEEMQMAEMAKTDPRIHSVAGKYTFEEELQLISHLDLMLSMDSGNGHLAALYGVPVVTIWLGTHPYAGFAPLAQPAHFQISPDLKQFPFLPNSVFGDRPIPEYEAVVNSISPKTIVGLLLKNLRPLHNDQ